MAQGCVDNWTFIRQLFTPLEMVASLGSHHGMLLYSTQNIRIMEASTQISKKLMKVTPSIQKRHKIRRWSLKGQCIKLWRENLRNSWKPKMWRCQKYSTCEKVIWIDHWHTAIPHGYVIQATPGVRVYLASQSFFGPFCLWYSILSFYIYCSALQYSECL